MGCAKRTVCSTPREKGSVGTTSGRSYGLAVYGANMGMLLEIEVSLFR